MNKEVIYLEPEDDITDILTKLQQAEQKLVALVPPKKGTILRSAVNMKLVARVAKECEKVAVIVTADPAIVKMAMAAKIPVAKTLQSRPVVPTPESVRASEMEADVINEDGEFLDEKPSETKNSKNPSKTTSKGASVDSDAPSTKSADTLDLTEESLENDSERPKNGKKPSDKSKKAAKTPKVPSLDKYRKWILIGVATAIVAAVVLTWAFVFAPAVTITVAVSSTASNFSESVRFTTDPAAENLEEGVLFVEKQSLEEHYTTDFKATGEEDRGNKASGTLSVFLSFSVSNATYINGFEIDMPVGTVFQTTSGARYRATTAAKMSWDGSLPVSCTNGSISKVNGICNMAATIQVEAVESGEQYNISGTENWVPFQTAEVSNSTDIAGGTTNIVKVVSEEDVDKVKTEQLEKNKEEGRKSLLDDIKNTLIPIKDSFTAEAGELTSTPAVGDEVGENTTPNLKMTAVYSVYTIERAKVEDYIKHKTNLADDQKIYSIGNPYFERFTSIEDAARLKTTIETGPTVTEESILEKAQGRKTGEVQSLLRSINGVSSVEIRPSYFWVWSVPTDPNKITINLKVEDR